MARAPGWSSSGCRTGSPPRSARRPGPRGSYPRRRHRVGIAIELAVTGRGGHAHRPVAGAAHVGRPAALERLVGPHPITPVVDLAVGRLDQLLEDVVEAFVPEVALLLGHPFLEPEVR